METIATGFGSPDDLTISPSGDILFGDFGNGAINIIKANAPAGSRPSVVASGLKDPEGLLVMQDGTIIVAEQKTNRILAIDPATGKSTLLRQLVNDTGQDGVDGLGLDPATGDILIPDSPYGRLLRMSRDGKSLSVVATGFVRPTGVAVEQRGTMVVADEFGNAVYRLQADGSHRTKIASIFQPDDVVLGPDGGIFVNSLGGDIVRIDPSTGAKRVLLSGLNLPHGIWVDSSGRVVVAEAGRNRILSITP